MIARILCPIDFSEASGHAIEHSLAIARWYKASITALHVCRPAFVPVPGLPPADQRISEKELKRAESEARACFARCGTDGLDLDVFVDVGAPAGQILQWATARSADLIVMGTHGASGFEHLVLGSVTEKVLRKASCPVLTVPPHSRATSKLPFKQLLAAVDFSESSIAGLDLAVSIAREAGASVTTLHVIEWPWEEPPSPSLEGVSPQQVAALAEYRRYLERSAMDRLKGLWSRVGPECPTAERVVHGKPYIEILRTAADLDADLVVIGVHGRNAADLMLFGSTTNQVVRRATCPVLTLRH